MWYVHRDKNKNVSHTYQRLVCLELYFYQNHELKRSVSNGSCYFPKRKRVSVFSRLEGYEMENDFLFVSYDFVLFIIKTIGFLPE